MYEIHKLLISTIYANHIPDLQTVHFFLTVNFRFFFTHLRCNNMFTLCFNFHRPLRISVVCNYFEHSCNTSTIFSFYVNLKEFCLSDNFFPSMLKIVSCLHWIASNKRSINQKCFGNNSKKKSRNCWRTRKKLPSLTSFRHHVENIKHFFFIS